jgi:hypothetical protein
MPFNNAAFNRTALLQIRDILKLPPQASHADLVAKVRENKAVVDSIDHAVAEVRTNFQGGTAAATAEQDDDDLPIGPRR